MFVLQCESISAIYSESMSEDKMKQKLFCTFQTEVRVEIKRVFPESALVEYNHEKN